MFYQSYSKFVSHPNIKLLKLGCHHLVVFMSFPLVLSLLFSQSRVIPCISPFSFPNICVKCINFACSTSSKIYQFCFPDYSSPVLSILSLLNCVFSVVLTASVLSNWTLPITFLNRSKTVMFYWLYKSKSCMTVNKRKYLNML